MKEVLKHGDWLVIRGITTPDNFISTATNTPLSHAAIYDADNDEVIEADNKGVHATPLESFIKSAHRIFVIRPIWSTPENSVIAINTARSLIGSGYNYTGLVGLGIPGRFYCTKLAVAAYEPVMKEKPDNRIPRIIKPGQMYFWGKIIYDSGPYNLDKMILTDKTYKDFD